MRTAASVDARYRLSPTGARTGIVGMWVALSGILMLFTALTSAYIVRAGLSDDWRPLVMPRLLWLSTGLILASSVSLEVARRCLKRGKEQAYSRWLLLTVVLGVSFLGAQWLAWRELVAQGVYIATNPHSSFFYLLTGTHGVHLLVGILALDYLLLRARRRGNGSDSQSEVLRKQQTATDVVALYWHFMGGLWVYLFLLLFLWR